MKTMKIIFIMLIGFLTAVGCNNDKTGVLIQYGCEASYQLKNKTDKEIYVKRIYSQTEEQGQYIDVYKEYTIPQNKTKEIFNVYESVDFETMIDVFNGEDLLIRSRNISVEVYVDERQLNEILLDKVNWESPTTNEAKVTYLLVVTDELIESVGYKSEE